MMPTDYELVAVQHSYYSAKVRACLQYKRLPYQEIGANIETIANRVIPATDNQQFTIAGFPKTPSCGESICSKSYWPS